ncbi:hypothetical protein ACO0LK_24110 [Undibacterium sp. Ji49W]
MQRPPLEHRPVDSNFRNDEYVLDAPSVGLIKRSPTYSDEFVIAVHRQNPILIPAFSLKEKE